VPRLQLSARELSATEVDFVSLVKRGANRLPFRIVKEDTDDMLDLARLTRVFRKADPVPAVIAAVVRKGADLEAAERRLGDAGLSLEAREEQGELVIFRQPGVESANDALIKLDDDIGLVVSGLAKALDDTSITDTAFGKLFATEAFFPSMRLAKDMLGQSVGAILQKAETPGEAAALIAGAVDDFKSYVTGLAAAMPQHALKADVGKADLEPLAKSVTINLNLNTPSSNIEGSPTHGNDTDTRLTTQGTNGAIESSPTAGNETPRNPAEKPNIGTSAASNDIEGNPIAKADAAAMLKGVESLLEKGLGDMRAQLTQAMAGVQKNVAGMEVRLDQVERRAQKAEEAVRGTVTSDAAADRADLRKATGRKIPPLLDTAFMKLEQDEAA
jgi:hypothetical protein